MIKFEHNPIDFEISISSPFAYRIHPVHETRHHHSGNDIRPRVRGIDGDNIYAVADGKVIISKVNSGGINNGYGYYILLQHDGWCSLYGHLMGLDVIVGQKVKAGEQIGRMGNTGTSTSTHLHFQIYNSNYSSKFFSEDERGIDMYAVDPSLYYVSENKEWDEILVSCLDDPDNWLITIEVLKSLANMDSNLGDLEILKYIDELIIKVYEYGLYEGRKK